MANYSGLILAGTPHPNDAGLLYNREPKRLYLAENRRAIWYLDSSARAIRDGRIARTILIPRRPSTVLEDGLLMIAAKVLRTEEVCSALKEVFGTVAEDLPAIIDLKKSVTNEQHQSLIELSRRHSVGYYFKLIISSFSDSSLERQLPILENYGYDVEVLTPSYTRLYSRWLKSTVIQGDLNDMPGIKNEQVIKH